MYRLKLVVILLSIAAPVIAQSSPAEKLSLSDQELLACSESHRECDQHDIVAQLRKRNHAQLLAKLYRKSNAQEKYIILEAMYGMKGATVTNFMRRVAYSAPPDAMASEPLWFALQYLAERCEPEALERLLRKQNFEFKDPGTGYPIGCMYWDLTLRQFGRCNYRPAIPRLKWVLNQNYACLNIHEAADYSLAMLRRKAKR